MTKKGDFEGAVNLLNTPERLINYETRHFEHYLDESDERPEGFVKFTPKKMFNDQVGSCSSFSVFESYVLYKHDFDVFTLYYISELDGDIFGHTITIYKDENNKYKYLTNIGNFELDNNSTDYIRTHEETFQEKEGTRKDLYSFIS